MRNLDMPDFGRKRTRTVTLTGNKVHIYMPDTKKGRLYAKELEKAIAPLAGETAIKKSIYEALCTDIDAVTIVAGNITDNDAVKGLYNRLLCLTDLRYPGKNGYELRTLIDPFGGGNNLLLIGYSDDEGFDRGMKAFIEKLDGTVPFLNEVHATRWPVSDVSLEKTAAIREPDDINLIPSLHVSNWAVKAWLAYATAEESHLRDYLRAWDKMIEFSKKNPDQPQLVGCSIGMCGHAGSFWLAVHTGLIPDEKLADIERIFYRWMTCEQGIPHVRNYQDTSGPAHNIVLFSALACIYLTEYFIKTYGSSETLEEIKTVAHRAFGYFRDGRWRPYCDDSSYALHVSLPLAVCYSLFEPSHAFLENGFFHAKPFLLAMHNPSGFIPSFGDGGVSKQAALLCRVFAYHYRDPDIQQIIEQETDPSAFDLTGMFMPFHSFTGKPVPSKTEPIDRTQVIELADWHYKEAAKTSKPDQTVPKRQAYDKLHIVKHHNDSAKLWDYILIDGLGIETHCKNNTLGVLDLSINATVLLVEESGYRWPDRESCTTVTISKDGYSGKTPMLASLDVKKIDEHTAYIQSTIPYYNGLHWTRTIFHVFGYGTVIHDSFTAVKEGEYTVYAHFRIPAIMEKSASNEILGTRHRDPVNSDVEVIQRLSSFSKNDLSVLLEHIPFGTKKFETGDMGEPNYKKPEGPDGFDMWDMRYRNKDAVISKYTALMQAVLNENETISFTHLLELSDSTERARMEQSESGAKAIFYRRGQNPFTVRLPFTPHIDEQAEDEPVDDHWVHDSNEEMQSYIFAADIQNICKTDTGHFVISYENQCAYYDPNGMLLFRHSCDTTIRSLAVIEDDKNGAFIAIGYDDKYIQILDHTGHIMQTIEIKRQPTLLSSWESKFPKVFSLAFVPYGDSWLLLAGCGDNHVKCFDEKGRLKATHFAQYRIIDRLLVGDYACNDSHTVMAYASDEASSGIIFFYDADLQMLSTVSCGAWLYTVKQADFRMIDGVKTLAVAMSADPTLIVFEKKDETWTRRYAKNVAGCGTTVVLDPTTKSVLIGTDKGYVKAFDMQGNETASRYVGLAVRKMVVFEQTIVIASEDSYLIIDQGFDHADVYRTRHRIVDVFVHDKKLMIATEGGLLHLHL